MCIPVTSGYIRILLLAFESNVNYLTPMCPKGLETLPTRWAPTSYKWSYNHYKWPYNWVTGDITLLIEVITPLVTSRGPTLYKFSVISQFMTEPSYKGHYRTPTQTSCTIMREIRKSHKITINLHCLILPN